MVRSLLLFGARFGPTWRVLVVLSFLSSPASADGWLTKPIDQQWTWFDDYLVLYASYTLVCSSGCSCEVGMGVKLFGEPRGEKKRFSDVAEVLAVGMGAVHIRTRNDTSPCKAAMHIGEIGTVPVVDIEW